MEHFLERLAKVLVQQHGSDLARVAVVLPGRRAGIHLQKYLAGTVGKALWSPELFDPASFMARISGLRQGGSAELLFLLFEAHKHIAGERAEPLSQVLQWAPVTLRDMGQVDAHLLDLEQVYRDLRSYQEIEEWSIRAGIELSPAQHRAVHQWERTRELHLRLNAMMEERAVAGAGLIARKAAGLVVDPAWRSPWDMVWFAGLNALEPAAWTAVERMVQRGLGKVAWDADRYYLDDAGNEAGRFLRTSIATLGEGSLPIPGNIMSSERTVETVHVPNRIAQVHFAADQLAALSTEERARTVVVLAEEDLLLPLLDALPPDIGPMNITMGVALNALPVHGLVEAFLDMHTSMTEDGPLLPDLERLLLHPFLRAGRLAVDRINEWRNVGMSRIPRATAMTAVSADARAQPSIERALAPMTNAKDAHDRIRQLIAWASTSCGEDRLAREQLFQLARMELGLENAIARHAPDEVDLHAYRTIRERALREERLPLFGEPLSGLQVMGLLETRAIDHDRVIILGATEEGLSSRVQQSWIPFDIRRHNRLPLREDTEAIAAYHVHRLLHGARELYLVDHTGADGTGERTRLVSQWQHELAPSSATRIIERIVQAPLVHRHIPSIVVEKSADVLVRITSMAERGFSPSALGTWLRCPLDFHFTHLLGIREHRAEDGTLGSDILGNAVHALLETTYRPFLGQRIVEEDLRDAVAGVPDALRAQLKKVVRDETLGTGHFKLSMEMAVHGVRSYLEREAVRCAVEDTVPIALEEVLTGVLASGDRVRGRCDRLETRNGLLHVLDLKTGGVRPEELALKGLEREHLAADRRYALQLLIYAFMAFQHDPSVERLRAGIIPLRKPSASEGIWLTIAGSDMISRAQLPHMGTLLERIIAELKDPAMPFRHDPRSEWCASCVG